MNARPELSQAEMQTRMIAQRLSRRPAVPMRQPVAVPHKPDQASFYRWLLGWLVLVVVVACIRLALMP